MGRYLLDSELLALGYDESDPAALYVGADGKHVLTKFGGYGKWGRSGWPHDGWQHVIVDHEGRPLESNPFEFVFPRAEYITPWQQTKVFSGDDRKPTLRADGSAYIIDDGEMGPRCEMCEKERIRWVHRLEHSDLPGVILDCGCVCAG